MMKAWQPWGMASPDETRDEAEALLQMARSFARARNWQEAKVSLIITFNCFRVETNTASRGSAVVCEGLD